LTALDLLQKYWKHQNFRKSQEDIIHNVINGKDVLALLPTGGGKSVCYQIPTLLKEGICIVVSPLIALMQDQVNSLVRKGIKAIAVTSKLTESEIIIAFDNLRYGNIKFLYLSPEKLQSDFIQEKIKQLQVNLIAIDEAHCISEWGHDFRPSYLEINTLKELVPNTPIIALTATATDDVVKDIINLTPLTNPKIFKETFQRKNLAYQVFETEDIYHQLKLILNKIKEPSIIYVSSRKKTKSISDYLNKLGYKSTYYHGGLSNSFKEKSFKKWLNEESNIMVATNAFGMGIDKDNVKVVIHIDIPNSIENYVQEAGRAGRNGKKAFSVILFNHATLHEFNKKIKHNIIEIDFLNKIYNHLNQFFYISKGELLEQKYTFNLQDFCSRYKLNLFNTYNAILLLEKEGILTYDHLQNKQSTVLFKTSNEQVLNYTKTHPKYQNLLHVLLRSYGGIFENSVLINESFLAEKLKTTKQLIIKYLHQIAQDHIIQYIEQTKNTSIQFLVMREDKITINRISKNIIQRNTIKKNKAGKIADYIQNNKICRNVQLLSYFNEKIQEKCGICDVCLREKNKPKNTKQLSQEILKLLKDETELSSKEMILLLKINKDELMDALRFLLEQNSIKLASTNKYKTK